MVGIFYISAFMLLYAYALYSIVLMALGTQARERDERDESTSGDAPAISVIVAAYNEEDCIANKIKNFLDCRYAGIAEMIVVSDGSTDKTAEIANSMASERVRVIARDSRAGKGAAVNAGAAAARGEVLVFTDANTMFAADALTELVRPLRDKSIGLGDGSIALLGRDDWVGIPEIRAVAFWAGVAARGGRDGGRRDLRDAPQSVPRDGSRADQ